MNDNIKAGADFINMLEAVEFIWNTRDGAKVGIQSDYEKFAALRNYNYEYKMYQPPKANWRWKFGDSPDVYFQFHTKKPPNRFQRWLFQKMLGIKWERVE
jgi:hypothetical protein